MPQDITPARNGADIIEAVIAKGDLAKLSIPERTQYYVKVCESVGLNPLTQPLAYITLNGRMTLYALKGATDQLRMIHGISVEELTELERDGVFVVTVKVRNRDGRTDMEKGAVAIQGLKGDALCNQMMKAVTKAKRRATLSLCGLGLLDETELETIPASAKAAPPMRSDAIPIQAPQMPMDQETGEVSPHTIPVPVSAKSGQSDWIAWGGALVNALNTCETRTEGEAWIEACRDAITNCNREFPKVAERVALRIEAMRQRLPDAGEVEPDFMEAVS